MRILTSILGLAWAATLPAAETWRWVDANGVVHYSDQPMPGATRVELTPAPPPGSVAPAAGPRPATVAPTGPAYTSCGITSPQQDQVFTNQFTVSASLTIVPGVRDGDRVVVYMNGRTLSDWPGTSLGHQIQNLNRGSYTLQAQVVDGAGRIACSSSETRFHIRQPSMLAPQPPAAQPPNGQPPNPNTPRPGVVPGVPRAGSAQKAAPAGRP